MLKLKRRGLGGYADARNFARVTDMAQCSIAIRCLDICWNFARDCKSLPRKSQKVLGGYADAKLSLQGAVPQKQGSRVQTMPKYDGTLPKVIASHIRPLPLKV